MWGVNHKNIENMEKMENEEEKKWKKERKEGKGREKRGKIRENGENGENMGNNMRKQISMLFPQKEIIMGEKYRCAKITPRATRAKNFFGKKWALRRGREINDFFFRETY